MKNVFSVNYGSIYNNNSGCIIEKPAFIIDRGSSVLKYGDAVKGLYDKYLDMVQKCRSCGLEDMANDLVYIEFDRYMEMLTVEEICVFANYIAMCSVNGSIICDMLKMNSVDLKEKIKKLSDMGY